MSNLNERLQQQVPLIDPSESPAEEESRSGPAPAHNPGRVSQLVNNVNINNIIQSNSFLHSDLGNFMEITPANTNMPNIQPSVNNPTHGHSHNHGHSHSENEGPAQTVVNLQGETNEEIDPSQAEQTGEQAHPGAAQGNNLVSFLVSSLTSSLPFFILLIAKIFHQHLLGFFIVLGFMTTLHWSNRSLVHQVELRDKKQNKRLIMLVLFLLLNITVFFTIFKEYRLYNCLVFLSPNVPKMDTWNLIWIVVCSDTIIKYITISLKASITILPFKIMPLRKRGSFYSLIENVALFYRSLIPIHPWILFLFYADTNIIQKPQSSNSTSETPVDSSQESTTFLIFLCIFYSIFKLRQLYCFLKEFRVFYKETYGDMSSVRLASANTESEDNVCPICQDKLASPVILKCRHIFCEDCVCVWLDKENSCPMCRAKISVKKPMYKDGSTTIFIQWY